MKRQSAERTESLNDEQYERLALLRYTLRRFLEFSAIAARDAGLTPHQHQALLAIRGFATPGGLLVRDLAERLFLRPHTTVELVDRLVEAALVRRVRDAKDRRRVHLHLTPRAKIVLEALSRVHIEQIRRDADPLIATLTELAVSRDGERGRRWPRKTE